MNALRTPIRVLVLGLALALAAAPARADGPSALEQLTPRERAYLEEKVPGWSEMPEARRERIAQNVLRLRDLSPEERDAFVGRVKEIQRRHDQAPQRSPLDVLRGKSLLVRALGRVLFEDLPAGTEASLAERLGPDARSAVEVAFFRRVLDRAVAARQARGFDDLEPPPGVPPERARRFLELKTKAAGGDAGAQRMLAMLALGREHERFLGALSNVTPSDRDRLREAGAKFKERYAEAYAASLKELETALAGDEESLRELLRDATGGRGGEIHRAVKLLRQIEEAKGWLEQDPALLEAARRFQALLIRSLVRSGGIPPLADDASPQQRREWLRRLFERFGQARDGEGRPGPGSGRRGPFPGPRGPR